MYFFPDVKEDLQISVNIAQQPPQRRAQNTLSEHYVPLGCDTVLLDERFLMLLRNVSAGTA
jgi:hypothetical protein